MTSPAVVFIPGRDPQKYVDDSHCGYMRAHGYAAARAGYDVHILCLSKSNRTESTAYGTLHAIETRLHLVRQNQIPIHSPRLTLALDALVRNLGSRATIIHGFGVWGHPAVHASRHLNSAGIHCKSIVGSYTTYLDESLSQWRGLVSAAGIRQHAIYAFEQVWVRTVINRYERFGYRNANRILVNYRSVQRMIKSRFGDDLRCELVPYTIEKEFEPAQQIASKPPLSCDATPVIVSIARHMPRKGIDILLRGLQSVKASGLPFSAHIVGGGPLLEKHRMLLESLHLSDRVTIHGIVPNVDEYLGQADIFVLPSREEQSGSLAMIEAMHAGVACVASACDGIPEDVTHLSDAWLTTPGNHQSLADGIIALLKDSCLRNRIANAGRNTFKRRFSGGAFSQALDSVYRNTLSD